MKSSKPWQHEAMHIIPKCPFWVIAIMAVACSKSKVCLWHVFGLSRRWYFKLSIFTCTQLALCCSVAAKQQAKGMSNVAPKQHHLCTTYKHCDPDLSNFIEKYSNALIRKCLLQVELHHILNLRYVCHVWTSWWKRFSVWIVDHRTSDLWLASQARSLLLVSLLRDSQISCLKMRLPFAKLAQQQEAQTEIEFDVFFIVCSPSVLTTSNYSCQFGQTEIVFNNNER